MNFQEISTLLYFENENIARINKIVNKYPIAWKDIADLLEEGIPLIDYMGPDGILLAIIREKEMRHLNESNR